MTAVRTQRRRQEKKPKNLARKHRDTKKSFSIRAVEFHIEALNWVIVHGAINVRPSSCAQSQDPEQQ